MPELHAIDRIIELLSPAKRVLITTHVRPDGDAIGSTAALHHALRRKQIESTVLLLSHLPSKYAFVYREHDVPHVDAETAWPAEADLSRFDALAVVDTGTWDQLPGLRERAGALRGPTVVIDHHLTQEPWGEARLVDTTAAAAGEVVLALLRRWEIPLDRAIAEALYVAITSDTGWFQFSNTSPTTLRLSAELLEAGVDADRIYQMLYQSERSARVRLQSAALQTLELLCHERVAVMTLTADDFGRTGSGVNDTENIVNMPLQIRNVQAALLITEPPEGGAIRVSMRSKGGIDCARFAERFGGGGHARAAGMKFRTGLPEARQTVVGALCGEFGGA